MYDATRLPIDTIETQYKSALKNHHLVVEAETGSGKSTRLPIWSQCMGRVLVVQPRRIACTSLASYLAEYQGEQVGASIGYAVKFEHHYTEQTKTVFVTPGVALRWFSEDKLASFDVIIIDEMHLRRWDTDLLLSLLKDHQQHRVVLTSATLNSRRFADFLDASVLKAEGRRFHVEVTHAATDSRHSPDARNLEERVTNAVIDWGNNNDVNGEQNGDILVFLPGRKEIQQTLSRLRQHAFVQEHRFDVIPLHASVSDDERHRALNTSKQRRIILATNIAETSLTIPGITLIIDSGLERRTHQRNGRTVLSLHAISQASAEQRKGRAGRIMDGQCVRLYGSAAPLEAVTPPDMLREELIEPMLAAACCGKPLARLDFIEALPDKTFSQAQQRLIDMAAIDKAGNVTEHGKKLYPLPIDPLFAHLITAMPNKATQEAMVDLASALSVPQRVATLPKDEERLEALSRWEPLHCDANMLIQLVRGLQCDALTINEEALKESQQNAQQIREALSLPHLDVASRIPREQWLSAVADATPELVFVRRQRRDEALGNGYAEVILGREQRTKSDDIAFIVFDQFHLPGKGKKQTLNLATCCSPLPITMLVEKEFGETTLVEGDVVDGQIQMTQQRWFAGRLIASEVAAPDDTLLVQAVAKMIIEEQLFPGLASRLAHDMAQWALYGELEPTTDTSAPQGVTLEAWLIDQLEALGIESFDDLALFNDDDFHFDGIPEWERDEFDARYPRRLHLADLTLTVEYHPKGKRITVHYFSGGRKDAPKRWELPSWSGWRIRYKKASRVIDVK
ncbi:helicase-related protein [Thaumasiovibrio subtropicus]|uniref:helicase-related protein n=1 Tax=Thaumasiovibrio subtropicus TaxID=1891207 RepID=UPI000B360C0F|nr:helicase-related protein [Thaumasiovibrio subtropicus]